MNADDISIYFRFNGMSEVSDSVKLVTDYIQSVDKWEQ